MARFLIDAQLPPVLADRLREAGHDAEHVNRIGLGAAPDSAVWHHASSEHAILITKDIDFLPLLGREPSAPAIIWVRIGNTTNAALWKAFGAALSDILAAIAVGERIIELR